MTLTNHNIPIIGIAARASSGKSTVGKMLLEASPGGRQFAFATRLKEICMDMFGLSSEDVNTEEGKSRKSKLVHAVCPNCLDWNITSTFVDNREQLVCAKCSAAGAPKVFQQPWTNREILQFIGDKFRYANKSVWADIVLRQVADLSALKKGRPKYAVITDCRYQSEVEAVRAAGGVIWRLKRPETDGKAVGIAGHASESEIDRVPEHMFSAVITNDGSLDQLREVVSAELQRHLRATGS
jgi:hypothetical protein